MKSDKPVTTLDKPTIGDMIKKLSEYPSDMPFRIEDADTNWTIDLIHFEESDGKLFIKGEYGEMSHD